MIDWDTHCRQNEISLNRALERSLDPPEDKVLECDKCSCDYPAYTLDGELFCENCALATLTAELVKEWVDSDIEMQKLFYVGVLFHSELNECSLALLNLCKPFYFPSTDSDRMVEFGKEYVDDLLEFHGFDLVDYSEWREDE